MPISCRSPSGLEAAPGTDPQRRRHRPSRPRQPGGREGKVAIEKESEGTYTYTGPQHVAFGVELHELTYDERRDKMKMLVPEGAIGIRGAAAKRAAPLLKPAFVETDGDDAFFDLD